MTQTITGNARHDEVRARAFDDLRRFEVVMEGHFDYGNGFHGKLYLNPPAVSVSVDDLARRAGSDRCDAR